MTMATANGRVALVTAADRRAVKLAYCARVKEIVDVYHQGSVNAAAVAMQLRNERSRAWSSAGRISR